MRKCLRRSLDRVSCAWGVEGLNRLLPGVLAAFVIGACGAGSDDDEALEVSRNDYALESCSGATDDDLDGLADCVDPDCNGNAACTGSFSLSCRKFFMHVSTDNGVLRQVTPTAEPFSSTLIGSALGYAVNAMGYNPRDGYLYAVRVSNDHLIRINANGAGTDLGLIQVAGVTIPDADYVAGDMDDKGNLWIKDNAGAALYKVPVASPQAATRLAPATAFPGSDMVFNPDLEILYAVVTNTLHRYTIATNTTASGALTGTSSSQALHGAIWADGDGYLYALTYNANNGALRRIDPWASSATLVGSWLSGAPIDGAGCTYTAPPFEICSNGTDDDLDGTSDETSSGAACFTLRNSDNDSVVNVYDLDDDNDGIPDSLEQGDSDGDRVPDRLDLDSDNDGILDIVEAGHGSADTNRNGFLDETGAAFGANGLLDTLETNADAAVLNFALSDVDGDGVIDASDLDSDNDGISDLIEAGYVAATVDADNNGVVTLGTDTDFDGIQNLVDGATGARGDNDAALTLPDADTDSVYDFREVDANDDTRFDIVQTAFSARDANADGRIDDVTPATNNDKDGDGIRDLVDDSDLDGTFDPTDTSLQAFGGLRAPDRDSDGVRNSTDLDDDNDGIPDTTEGTVDTDADGTPDVFDLDSDGDTRYDAEEAGHTTASSAGVISCTGALGLNGLCNALETAAESGVINYTIRNSDGTDNPDFQDIDSDNDGYCDDAGGQIFPGATDDNCDGNDQDCDATPDDDYVPTGTTCGAGVCASTGTKTCVSGIESDSCSAGTPTGDDTNCNGADENCDGTADEGYVPTDTTCGLGVCASTGSLTCVNGAPQDSCTLNAPTGDDTDCDGVDDDCDGAADDGFTTSACVPTLPNCTEGASACNQGVPSCTPAVACVEDPDDDGICTGAVDISELCTGGPDNCPAVSNSDQTNRDDDPLGDACDPDLDGDGVCNGDFVDVSCEGVDNCPNVPNSDQTNTDGQGDGGDACDDDDDDDGVCDGPVAVDGTCIAGPDSDPTDGESCADSDDDTCDDCSVGKADPDNDGEDTDADGTCDEGEDSDGDDVRDVADLDDDGDGLPDALENELKIAPNADRDDDGVPNYADADDVGNGEAAQCDDEDSDGRCDALAALFDFDGDGKPNHLDLDSDDDGLVDALEAGLVRLDEDGDGLVDGNVGANGLADAVETAVDNGAFAFPLLDTDGDDERDAVDLDSDGDGKFDLAEVGALLGLDLNNDGRIDDETDADGDGIRAPADDDTKYAHPATDARASDGDGDGIPSAFDADEDGPGAGDSDRDGNRDDNECKLGWPCPDEDGDGVPNYMTEDEDGDGVPSAVDLDDDNDGIVDAVENAQGNGDADGDGTPNAVEIDADADGITDLDEAAHGAVDLNRDGMVDGAVGANGIPDVVESLPDSGIVPAPVQSDADGTPDFVDQDADDDTLNDLHEAGDSELATLARDSDGDGVRDYRDADDDGDGLNTRYEGADRNGDHAPDDASNRDGDDKPDYLDLDDDGDGLLTSEESADPNGNHDPADARDTDGDDAADYLDDDDDGDGVLTKDEAPDANLDGKVADARDTDADGTPDYLDDDDDGDGISTAKERVQGDTDRDGTPDYLDLDDDDDGIPSKQELEDEAKLGGDVDGDGTPAYLDEDSDNDGALDRAEKGKDDDDDGVPDYLDADTQTPDSDGDGLPDDVECTQQPCEDTDEDGDPDYLDPDDDGDSLPTKSEVPRGDSDEDEKPDYLDPDDDDDSVPTKKEAQRDDTDKDKKPDYLDPDDDGDGKSTRSERPGNKDVDTDKDGTPDYLDADDDGDGIPTDEEAEDANGNGIPDRLEDTTGTLAGGATCTAAPSANAGLPLWSIALGLAALLRSRRRSPRART